MKKFVFLLCFAAMLSSCKKAKDLLDISFSFSTTNDFTLPKFTDQVVALPDSVVSIQTPAITNTAPDEFKKNHADINKLKSLKIESIVLTIKSPPGQTFSFMKSIKVYLGSQGIPEKLIATRNDINLITPPTTTLSLTQENADLIDIIKAPTYYLRVETALVSTYTQDITIGSTIKFNAVANPLN